MSGFSSPAAAKMSITPSDATACEMILTHGVVHLLLGPCAAGGALGEHGLHGLEEPHIVPDVQGVLVRHGQGKGLGQLAHGLHAAVFPVFLRQDVFLSGGGAGPAVPAVRR